MAFEIETPLLNSTQKLNLEFHNLTYQVKDNRKKGPKIILKDISGKFPSGNLIAILGPSGAGKTSLMNILGGFRRKNVSGQILVNGSPRDLKSFKKQSCYIMQQDFLLPYLTVREVMMDAAAFKMGDKVTFQNKKKMVSEVIEMLGLNDSYQTRIENLSGGEKKRLSIAVELVNNPPIMFFDEPTSGLDSCSTYQCIKLLKSLSMQGHTIICTIHQPSAKIFEYFDYIYGIAEGQCIYRGARSSLLQSLSLLGLECPPFHNPADFLIEIASGEYGPMVSKLASNVACMTHDKMSIIINPLEENGHQKLDLVPTKEISDKVELKCITEEINPKENSLKIQTCQPYYPASFCTQFAVIFKRTFLSIIRDTMLTHLRIGAHILVGIFIGILYYNVGNEGSEVLSNTGCILFSIIFLVFTAMMPTILVFPLEMNIFIKEHLNHWYSIKAYYLAKTMADFPFQVIFPILYMLIVYFMTGQPMDASRFFLLLTIGILNSLVAQTVGLTVGAALDVQQAVFIGPVLSVPILLFCGFFVKLDTVPIYLRWLGYLSYMRYAFEGSVISTYGFDRPPLNCSDVFCVFKFPSKILETFGFHEDFLAWDIILLVVYFLVLRCLGYIILSWKLKQER